MVKPVQRNSSFVIALQQSMRFNPLIVKIHHLQRLHRVRVVQGGGCSDDMLPSDTDGSAERKARSYMGLASC
jgi:hypothetical protein